MQLHIMQLISLAWGFLYEVILLFRLIKTRYSKGKTAVLAVGILCPLFLTDFLLILTLGQSRALSLFLLANTLPLLLFFYLIAEDRSARFVFTFCSVNTIVYWTLAVTELLDHYLCGGSGVCLLAGRMILFPLLNWWICKWLLPPYLELQECVLKGWWLFTALALIYYLLLVTMSGFPVSIVIRKSELPSYLLLLLLMPCTYITIFAFLYTQMRLYLSQKSAYLFQEQAKRLESQLESQSQIRKMRHDMKANVVTLSGLLAAGRTEEAQAFLKNIGADIDVTQRHFCGNPYLDSVFSHYSQKLEKMGAAVQMDIQVGSESLPDEKMLCQILANGMENACDALRELPQEEREFSAQMRYNRDYLLIRLKNKCDDSLFVERGNLPQTTKGGLDHGLGLLTVQDRARQMGGELCCYTEDGYFFTDVMVKVRKNQMAGKGAGG